MSVKTRCIVQPPRRAPRAEYVESNAFRVIHVDGARGGLRADRRSIHLTLFSERPRTPDYAALHRSDAEVVRSRSVDLVREVEVDAIFDTAAARRIVAVLIEALEDADRSEC